MDTATDRILDALPGMIWTALPDGRIDFVNRRWSVFTGLGLDHALGWEWQSAVHPDDLAGLLERWRTILTSGESGDMEVRVRRADGQKAYARFDARQVGDARVSSVQYLKFEVGSEAPLAVGCDHPDPELRHEADLTAEQRAALQRDLSE